MPSEKTPSSIRITAGVYIPAGDLTYTFSRSSKPGGQNVNKVSTRVTLRFDVTRSAALNARQRERIRERLGTRITRGGVLTVTSQKHRSQRANREAATMRFAELVREALRQRPQRKPTRATAAARQRRITEKKRRSCLKKERTKAWAQEE